MDHSFTLRPAFTPFTILLMVLGFMAFWPLGVLMLAYIVWGHRIPAFRQDWRDAKNSWKREFHGRRFGACAWGGSDRSARYDSGNSAFDEYRQAELRRLDEERRRLDGERAEFEAFVRNLRRAKDQEEFDRFMSERRGKNGGATQL